MQNIDYDGILRKLDGLGDPGSRYMNDLYFKVDAESKQLCLYKREQDGEDVAIRSKYLIETLVEIDGTLKSDLEELLRKGYKLN